MFRVYVLKAILNIYKSANTYIRNPSITPIAKMPVTWAGLGSRLDIDTLNLWENFEKQENAIKKLFPPSAQTLDKYLKHY